MNHRCQRMHLITILVVSYNSYDDGMISLTAMIQDQAPGDQYKFRVLHERVSGTAIVSSGNANLVAIALAHEGGGYFPSIYSHEEAC